MIGGRKLPALSILEIEHRPLVSLKLKTFCQNYYCRLKERLNADRIQLILLSRLEKFLRRFRIATLKVDNGTSGWLKKIREKTIAVTPAAYWTIFKKEKESAVGAEFVSDSDSAREV